MIKRETDLDTDLQPRQGELSAYACELRTPRDRDAWAAIRGYRYQVELTIRSWLSIGEQEVIELEKGEDIDLVTRAINSEGNETCERLLNQVKCREHKLTLGAPEVLTAIACFVEHRTANPNLTLTFRFTTNAQVACERPTLFERSVPALEVWKRMQRGELTGDEGITARLIIKDFLRSRKKPQGLNDSTWVNLKSFLESASDKVIEDVILRLEWMTGQDEPASLESDIKAKLIDQGNAASSEEADSTYKRLLCFVFKMLSSPGPKQLTRASLMAQLIYQPLSDSSKAILARFESLVAELEQSVAAQEAVLKSHSHAIARLQEKTGSLEKFQAELVFAGIEPSIQVPPLTNSASGRRESLDSVVAMARQHTWTAMHGPSGTGKTQLAILISQKLGRCSAWVRLSSLAGREGFSLLTLERSLEVASGCPTRSNRQEWYETICSRFGEGALIVLDDVSKLSPKDPLSESINLLCQAFRRHHISLLTTSPYPLQRSVIELLDRDIVLSIKVPPLSDKETGEILIAHGAPQEFLRSKRLSFINLSCRQHPTLVVAAAQYLRDREWKFSEKEFGDILGSRFMEQTDKETLDRLLSTVTNVESRELLERLTLIIYRFGDDEVRIVAGTSPPLKRPFDRLSPLLGPWIQHDSTNSYLVSPLAMSLGPINLSKDVIKLINYSLGSSLLQRKKLNQIDVASAVTYFCRAEAWDEAGKVFFRVLAVMQESGIPQYDAGILAFWVESPLPMGMNLGLRIIIRGLQVSLAARVGKRLDFLIKDLDSLSILASESEGATLFTASLNVTTATVGKNPEIACRYLGQAFRLLPILETHTELHELISQLHMESLIWFAAWHISKAEQIHLWLDAASKMPPWLLERARSSESAEIGCISITNEIWLQEAEKNRASQAWPDVRSTLASLASRALELGLELLWAASVRSQAIILAEYEDSFESSLTLGIEALHVAKDPRSRFLIEDCIARQYLGKKSVGEALEWFTRALEEPSTAFPLLHLQAYVQESVALSDNEKALELLQKAINIGLADEDIPRTELVKVLGEQCILNGLCGNLAAAYESLDAAVVQLLDEETLSLQWRAVFTVLSHISGYFSSIASWGHPPVKTNTEEPYATPSRGMFLRYDEQGCSSLYNDERKCAVFVQLTQFAEAIGKEERVEYWASAGMEAARKSRYAMGVDVLSLHMVPLLILRNQLADAQALAVESSAITAAAIKERSRGGETTTTGFDYESVLGPKPSVDWDEAETKSVMSGTLPIVCKIASECLISEENAGQLAQDAISGFKRLVQKASHTDLWNRAASVLEDAFVNKVSFQKLMAFSNSLDDEKYGWLRLAGYVGASMQPDCPLAVACTVHIDLLSVYHKHFISLSKATYNRILVPFVMAYWQRAYKENKFRFSSPSYVEHELARALEAGESGRAQQVMKIISRGLGIRLNSQAEDWLRGSLDER
jgi:tetratricopeptide (TPR) repeat protein